MTTLQKKTDVLPASFAGKRLTFMVRPRYTPGSPASVREDVCLRVAAEERRGHKHALSGARGPAQKQRAEALGLGGVAYAMFERGRGKDFRWHVYDFLTGEVTLRLHDDELRRQGYRRYAALSDAERRTLNLVGRDDDLARAWHAAMRSWYRVGATGTLEAYVPEPGPAD